MTVLRTPSGRISASITVHLGVVDSRAEAEEIVERVLHSEELKTLRAWLREEYGGNHGGYRWDGPGV